MPQKASIPPKWNVPELFRQRLGDVAGRQRAMASEGHLLLILHELPTEYSAQRNLRLFWRAPDALAAGWVLSVVLRIETLGEVNRPQRA